MLYRALYLDAILATEIPPYRIRNTASLPFTEVRSNAHRGASSRKERGLFDHTRLDARSLAEAANAVHDKYGEFTLMSATMANLQDVILKRVAFGSVPDLNDK